MRGDFLNSNSSSEGQFGAIVRPVEALTNAAAITRTLSVDESGKLFTLSLAAVDNNIALTLPPAASSAGVFFDFCVLANTDDDADFILTTGLDATDIYGYIVAGAADSTIHDVDGESKVTLDGSVSQATEGTRMNVVCDGVNWHLSGYVPVAIGTDVIVGAAGA